MEPDKPGAPPPPPPESEPVTPAPEVSQTSLQPTVDDSYGYHDDPYAYESNAVPAVMEQPAAPPIIPAPPTPPPPASPPDAEDVEEEGMLRMSFLDHLEELRLRLVRSLLGLAVAFILSLSFSGPLWKIVSAPARDALTQLGVVPPKLAQTGPMEVFSIVWMKMPLLTAIFLGSPWILFQIWSFIAPGLYKKERRLAAPFILTSAGLFILGGVFAYFVAFRFGLVFLLGIGRDPDVDVQTLITVTDYFDLFVNVMLGVSLVFELPVVIFFLTLLRIASPRFLMANARYAILGIVLLAAVITPTPDIFNMLLFAVPMMGLFFVGLLASYLLVMHREGKKFPWGKVLLGVVGVLLLLAGGVWLAIARFGYHFVKTWPFLVR